MEWSIIVGAFTDPIIVFPGGWGDTLPEWLKNAITMERLEVKYPTASWGDESGGFYEHEGTQRGGDDRVRMPKPAPISIQRALLRRWTTTGARFIFTWPVRLMTTIRVIKCLMIFR